MLKSIRVSDFGAFPIDSAVSLQSNSKCKAFASELEAHVSQRPVRCFRFALRNDTAKYLLSGAYCLCL